MSQMDLFSNIVDTGNKLYIKTSNGAFTIACDETIFDYRATMYLSDTDNYLG